MSSFTTLLFGLFLYQQVSLDEAVIFFKLNHLGVIEVNGTFNQVEGSFEKIKKDEWKAVGRVKVESLNTENRSRDQTVLSEHYLNADLFPHILFKAKLFVKQETPIMHLNLQVRGIDFELEMELGNEDGKLVSKPNTFSRKEIGLDFGSMDTIIGDEVEVVIHSGIKYQMIFN